MKEKTVRKKCDRCGWDICVHLGVEVDDSADAIWMCEECEQMEYEVPTYYGKSFMEHAADSIKTHHKLLKLLADNDK